MNVMPHTTPRTHWRVTFEFALAVTLLLVAFAVALSAFVGVDDYWIVLATIVAASIVGWHQPSARGDRPVPALALEGLHHPSMY